MISDEEQQELAPVDAPETKDVEEVPPLSIPDYVHELVTRARQAAGRLATQSTVVKNNALIAMADALDEKKAALMEANEKDVEAFGTEQIGRAHV